jgi:5-methyltetrahydrofolate--homocysteine methyltransferase
LTEEINHAAARLARRIANEYSKGGHSRFVAGSIGPSGKLLSLHDEDEVQLDFDGAAALFRQQAKALIEGGVDLLLLETQQDILEVKAAIRGIQAAFEDCGKRLPIQAQVTLDANGRMLLGTDIHAVLAILQGMGIDVIGMNCSTGPEHMRPALDYLCRHAHLPVSCLPNAGMPINRDGGAFYPLGAEEFAEQVSAFVRDFGVNVVGGCCGTTPEHLRLLVKALEKTSAKERAPQPEPALSSAFRAFDMHQVPAPFISVNASTPRAAGHSNA